MNYWKKLEITKLPNPNISGKKSGVYYLIKTNDNANHNDLKHGISADNVLTNICLFLQKFHEFFPLTHIFVLSILYSPKNRILDLFSQIEYINWLLQAFISGKQNSLHKIYSEELFHFVELGYTITNNIYYEEDLVHLEQRGYDILRRFILNRRYT